MLNRLKKQFFNFNKYLKFKFNSVEMTQVPYNILY